MTTDLQRLKSEHARAHRAYWLAIDSGYTAKGSSTAKSLWARVENLEKKILSASR